MRRMRLCNYRIASLALAAAISLTASACEARASGGGTRRGEVASASRSAPIVAGSATDPFSSLYAQLKRPVRDLFEVEASRPEYWRLLTLDRYDGDSWTGRDPEESRGGLRLSTPAALPQAAGSTYPADADSLTQTFRILSDLDGLRTLTTR